MENLMQQKDSVEVIRPIMLTSEGLSFIRLSVDYHLACLSLLDEALYLSGKIHVFSSPNKFLTPFNPVCWPNFFGDGVVASRWCSRGLGTTSDDSWPARWFYAGVTGFQYSGCTAKDFPGSLWLCLEVHRFSPIDAWRLVMLVDHEMLGVKWGQQHVRTCALTPLLFLQLSNYYKVLLKLLQKNYSKLRARTKNFAHGFCGSEVWEGCCRLVWLRI